MILRTGSDSRRSSVGTMLAAMFAAWSGGLRGTLVLTLAIGTGAAAGKLAFDSLVQRDAPPEFPYITPGPAPKAIPRGSARGEPREDS